MKKILFIAAVVATVLTASSFKKHYGSMSVTITHVESTPDGNKVFFEITSDVPTPYNPGLFVSTSVSKGSYDWGGNPFPQDLQTSGNVTTGYFLDGPLGSGNKKRYYVVKDWDSEGVPHYSDVFTYTGK